MKTFKILSIVFVLSFLLSGCLYNWIVPEEVPVEPGDPDAPEISFTAEVNPIFTSNCASCHKTGGVTPDLTADNAYTSINTSKYINTGTPEQSGIYLIPHPDESGHSQKKYTEAQAATILLWISQGAKNN